MVPATVQSHPPPGPMPRRRWSSPDHKVNRNGNVKSRIAALITTSIASKFRFNLPAFIFPWINLVLLLFVIQEFSLTVAYSVRPNAVPDTKGCCRSKGVSDYCLEKMCDTSRPPDEFDVFEVANDCTRYLSSVATCLSDGRNHTGCCRSNAKGTDDLCMHLCDGTPYYFNVSMWEEYTGYVACLTFNAQSIFNCLDRGYEMAPGPPERVQVLRTTATSVKLKWAPPNILPNKVARYSIHYAVTLDTGRRYVGWTPTFHRVDTEDASTSYELDRFTPDTKYRLYVVARGSTEDAISLPSESVEVVTEGVVGKAEPYKWKVESPAGLPATLICMVNTRGGGERENVRVSWYFGRNAGDIDQTPLPGSTSPQGRYQQIVRIAPDHPGSDQEAPGRRTYVAALTLSRVSSADFGIYKCTARTQFGDSSANLELVQASAPRAPQQPPNVTDCCVQEGVQPGCVASCQSNVEESTAVSLFQGSATCGQDFPKILRCAVGNGEQHREQSFCCLRRGIPLSCLFLCDSSRPMANQGDLFACIQYTNELLQCLAESKQYLPSPPVDLRIRQATGPTVTLAWSQEQAPLEVTAYHIFYKKRQEQNWSRITSGATTATITDLSRNVQYVVVVVSANPAGNSDPSRPLYFSNGGRLRDQSLTSSQRRRKSRNNLRHNHHQHFHNHHRQAIAVMAEE